jgi:hypothetical protein
MAGILEALNIIELFNIVLPVGGGEVIVLLTFMGFWGILAIDLVYYIMSKENGIYEFLCRIKGMNLGIIPLPGGRTIKVMMNPRESRYVYNNEYTWILKSDEFQPLSNGVMFTILHPDLDVNVSITNLVKFYTGYVQEFVDSEGNSHKYIMRKKLYSSRGVGSMIEKLASMDVARLNKDNKIVNVAIAIAMILAVAGAIAIVLAMLPTQVAQPVVDGAVSVTTTTVPRLSGIV